MISPLFTDDGIPDINAIIQHFPEHGDGRLRHHSTLGDEFEFMMTRNGDGTYDAIIVTQPTYRGRPDGPHETHRLPMSNGSKRVCFLRSPRDLPVAVTLTLWWAESTSKYILDGRRWG